MEVGERQARAKHRVSESPGISRDRIPQILSRDPSVNRISDLRHPSRDSMRNSLSMRDPVAAKASRASSREAITTQKKHSELLQTAIEHHRQFNETRSHSAQNLKHIPMIAGQLPPVMSGNQPIVKDWPTFAEPESNGPLAVLKDQYNTKRPIEVEVSKNDTFDNAHSRTPRTPHPKNMLGRMGKIMSLAKNTVPRDGELLTSQLPNYESQSPEEESLDDEDDSTNEEDNQDTLYRLEPSKPDLDSLQTMMNDLNDLNEFQSVFKDKHATEPKRNRTQQKVLDYRLLYSVEPTTPKLRETMYSHEIKIQHDTISSQYTSIRLRFSRTAGSGVLGFVQRANEPKAKTKEMSRIIDLGSKDLVLRSMWETEMAIFGLDRDNGEEGKEEERTYGEISLLDLARNVRLLKN